MKTGEFGEAPFSSSPSRSTSSSRQAFSNIHRPYHNFFPGDSSSTSVPIQSHSDYSSSSYFSDELHAYEYGMRLASLQLDGWTMPHHAGDHFPMNCNVTDELGLYATFNGMNIREQAEEENQVDALDWVHRDFTGNLSFNARNNQPIDEIFVSRGLRTGNPDINPELYGRGLNHGWNSIPQWLRRPRISRNMGYQTYDRSSLFCEGRSMGIEPVRSRNSSLIGGWNVNGSSMHQRLPNISEFQRSVYFMAKDQEGCRVLQKFIDEGTTLDFLTIFNEISPNVIDLMMDHFGNYLMQKILDVCTEEQRTLILVMATGEPGEFIHVSCNLYGTRVIQKLIKSIKTMEQLSLMKSALKSGFLDLIRDSNGNHVIHRCLQCFSTEDNEFIFDAATTFCTDMAINQHGCCVLQKCIDYSSGQQRDTLIAEVSKNSLSLAQDPFGNYAVQFVIEQRSSLGVSTMLTHLRGHYVKLSMQKFSSHVVERFLIHCPESRFEIVTELVTFQRFDRLLQDPYANFVIQAALDVTKGLLHDKLMEAIAPCWILRYNPYCRKIFSRYF